LAQLGFVDRHEAVHFLGPPGTGKSHLATALGVQAVKAGKSVYFTTLADLIGSLVPSCQRASALIAAICFDKKCATSLASSR
jgi:DNA replication protein DnaC